MDGALRSRKLLRVSLLTTQKFAKKTPPSFSLTRSCWCFIFNTSPPGKTCFAENPLDGDMHKWPTMAQPRFQTPSPFKTKHQVTTSLKPERPFPKLNQSMTFIIGKWWYIPLGWRAPARCSCLTPPKKRALQKGIGTQYPRDIRCINGVDYEGVPHPKGFPTTFPMTVGIHVGFCYSL